MSITSYHQFFPNFKMLAPDHNPALSYRVFLLSVVLPPHTKKAAGRRDQPLFSLPVQRYSYAKRTLGITRIRIYVVVYMALEHLP